MNLKTNLKSTLAALAIALQIVSSARAQFSPVPLDLSSYNQDMIVERPLPATTASMDNGPVNTGESFYQMGYYAANTATGLPAPGTTITSAAASDHSYTFAPDYTTNDAVLLDPKVTNATVTFSFPSAYNALSFLVASGNGAETIAYKVHHQDGTINSGTFVSPDWFNNSPVVYTANGRVDVQARTFDNIEAGNPRLYSTDITLTDTGSPVVSIDFNRTGSGGHGVIFAISGSTGSGFSPITFTGYNESMIIPAGAQSLPPNGLYTTASMDNGTANTGYSWYVQGFDLNSTNTGLPPAGSRIASAAALDHQYVFAPSYASNNVMYVDGANSPTVLWATPTKHSALSFLVSAGHGPVIVDYTVNHLDSTTETGTFTVPDWYNATPVAFNANGRVDVVTGLLDAVALSNPRLYTEDIPLTNTTSEVESVVLAFDASNTNSSSVVAFFAVSGTGGSLAPVIVTQPVSFNTNAATTAQIVAAVSGTSPLTYQWQKGLGGVFTNLTNGGRITGATAPTLTISSVTFSDAANYQLVVTNIAGSVTSSTAYLNVISTTPVITVPGDPISIYDGASPAAEVVQEAIDGTTQKYLNYGGNYVSTDPPFVGPVGFTVTPAMGSTVVTGLRLYTGNDSPERDPADFVLEGSNNGGSTFTTIASGTISMPTDRNAEGYSLNPITEFNRELNFPNQSAYTTYRFLVNNVRDNTSANSMQVAEVQLLGAKPSPAVTIVFQNLANGQLQLQWSSGTLQSSSTANGTYSTVSGATSPWTVSTTSGTQFYRVKVQ